MGKLNNSSEQKYWKQKLRDGTLDEMNVEIDVVKEHDLSSFLRGGLRTNPYLVFASGDQGQMQHKTGLDTFFFKDFTDFVTISHDFNDFLTILLQNWWKINDFLRIFRQNCWKIVEILVEINSKIIEICGKIVEICEKIVEIL